MSLYIFVVFLIYSFFFMLLYKSTHIFDATCRESSKSRQFPAELLTYTVNGTSTPCAFAWISRHIASYSEVQRQLFSCHQLGCSVLDLQNSLLDGADSISIFDYASRIQLASANLRNLFIKALSWCWEYEFFPWSCVDFMHNLIYLLIVDSNNRYKNTPTSLFWPVSVSSN